eukprot:TRINITY_DN7760_c0_g1_i2.p1 TRINITY_DN7760_c0_g1~~TRINITY_DN7760_c0_g1_i2.p1  ORF type:complete len:733 (+),score=214.77 TRINITY_DN7760_c0_g1_i2:93-2201(+)
MQPAVGYQAQAAAAAVAAESSSDGEEDCADNLSVCTPDVHIPGGRQPPAYRVSDFEELVQLNVALTAENRKLQRRLAQHDRQGSPGAETRLERDVNRLLDANLRAKQREREAEREIGALKKELYARDRRVQQLQEELKAQRLTLLRVSPASTDTRPTSCGSTAASSTSSFRAVHPAAARQRDAHGPSLGDDDSLGVVQALEEQCGALRRRCTELDGELRRLRRHQGLPAPAAAQRIQLPPSMCAAGVQCSLLPSSIAAEHAAAAAAADRLRGEVSRLQAALQQSADGARAAREEAAAAAAARPAATEAELIQLAGELQQLRCAAQLAEAAREGAARRQEAEAARHAQVVRKLEEEAEKKDVIIRSLKALLPRVAPSPSTASSPSAGASPSSRGTGTPLHQHPQQLQPREPQRQLPLQRLPTPAAAATGLSARAPPAAPQSQTTAPRPDRAAPRSASQPRPLPYSPTSGPEDAPPRSRDRSYYEWETMSPPAGAAGAARDRCRSSSEWRDVELGRGAQTTPRVHAAPHGAAPSSRPRATSASPVVRRLDLDAGGCSADRGGRAGGDYLAAAADARSLSARQPTERSPRWDAGQLRHAPVSQPRGWPPAPSSARTPSADTVEHARWAPSAAARSATEAERPHWLSSAGSRAAECTPERSRWRPAPAEGRRADSSPRSVPAPAGQGGGVPPLAARRTPQSARSRR